MHLILIEALKAKYRAEMLDAEARFQIYVKNPVAIGEHPQHTEEMDKLVQQYVDASDKLKAVQKLENNMCNSQSLKS